MNLLTNQIALLKEEITDLKSDISNKTLKLNKLTDQLLKAENPGLELKADYEAVTKDMREFLARRDKAIQEFRKHFDSEDEYLVSQAKAVRERILKQLYAKFPKLSRLTKIQFNVEDGLVEVWIDGQFKPYYFKWEDLNDPT